MPTHPRHGFGPGDQDPSPMREPAEWRLAGLNLWHARALRGTPAPTLGWVEQSWDRWQVFVRSSSEHPMPRSDRRPTLAEAAERLRELLAARGFELPPLEEP